MQNGSVGRTNKSAPLPPFRPARCNTFISKVNEGAHPSDRESAPLRKHKQPRRRDRGKTTREDARGKIPSLSLARNPRVKRPKDEDILPSNEGTRSFRPRDVSTSRPVAVGFSACTKIVFTNCTTASREIAPRSARDAGFSAGVKLADHYARTRRNRFFAGRIAQLAVPRRRNFRNVVRARVLELLEKACRIAFRGSMIYVMNINYQNSRETLAESARACACARECTVAACVDMPPRGIIT
jgi:hypothetical protein